jgi:membrane-bound lytic murein transglycosylase D
VTGYRYLVIGIILSVLQACTSLPETQTGMAPSPPLTYDNTAKQYLAAEEDDDEIGVGASGSAASATRQTREDEAKTAEDLWPYLTARFALLSEQQPTADVEYFMNKYAKATRSLKRMLDNANPYLAYVTEQIEQRQMPLEFALLPMIESHYTPSAYSPRHAAGLWQFIPSTGRRYGLKQNWWYDGRRDVIASTGAALDYLQDLHQKMDGDWLKALAAYNCGEGCVQKAEKRNRKANKPTDFWSLDLPRETEAYVPRLLALAKLFKQADTYAIHFPRLSKTNTLQLVETHTQIELERAAELANLDIQQLRLLNPGYLRHATDPDGPHYLLLPADKASLFSRQNENLSLAQRMPPASQGAHQHRIRKGETLWDIARHYDTTISALSKANNISKRSTLHVGKKLVIPHGDDTQIATPKVASSREKLAATRTHRIRKGETLWDIARHYNTSMTQLCQLNNISKRSTLKIGQKLKVPVSTRTVARNNSVKERWHHIRKGDTLWDIARLYNTSVRDLRHANNLSRRKPLKVGYKLKIPGKPRSQGI